MLLLDEEVMETVVLQLDLGLKWGRGNKGKNGGGRGGENVNNHSLTFLFFSFCI